MRRKFTSTFAALVVSMAAVLAAVPTTAQHAPGSAQPAERPRPETGDSSGVLHRDEYRIGAEDLLEILVFEAPELNRTVRVTAGGIISLPLIGEVRAAGLTLRQLEGNLQDRLRTTFLQDPHVNVFVRELHSRPVSVVGAVKKPGVFQIRERKTLVEVLAMAEGLAEDAGDTILVMHPAEPLPVPAAMPMNGASQEVPPSPDITHIDLKQLMESGEAGLNVVIHPGDVVKVTRAGIVYVVGEVKKPGGFVLNSNENLTVLQALALSEGLLKTAAKGRARIIRAGDSGTERSEIPVDLGKILAGKAADTQLQPRDILFVPSSGSKAALYKTAEAALSIVSGVIIFRR